MMENIQMSRDEYSKSKVQIYSPISHFYKDHFEVDTSKTPTRQL